MECQVHRFWSTLHNNQSITVNKNTGFGFNQSKTLINCILCFQVNFDLFVYLNSECLTTAKNSWICILTINMIITSNRTFDSKNIDVLSNNLTTAVAC